jgi:hypothetical protein
MFGGNINFFIIIGLDYAGARTFFYDKIEKVTLVLVSLTTASITSINMPVMINTA